LIGYLELSGGPNYSNEIVPGVALAWVGASALAVALAALVGWLVSRRMSAPLLALTAVTTQMSDGDLSIRATVDRHDEFGTLSNAFNLMAGRLEQTIEALRRFVADAAHELNTPLTALRNNLELALEEEDLSERNVLLKAGRSQIKRLEELAEGLLQLSRLEAAPVEATPTTLDWVQLVLKVSELYASQAEQKGLAFQLELPDGPILVAADDLYLRRAVSNLIDNAIKFTAAGGSVAVRLAQTNSTAMLTIADTGIGIPTEDLSHLFGRFHRGRNARRYPGSGLGLALVKAIVDSYGGEVSGKNTAEGATFSIVLPLAELPMQE
jgi:signal transduction histidine kinase